MTLAIAEQGTGCSSYSLPDGKTLWYPGIRGLSTAITGVTSNYRNSFSPGEETQQWGLEAALSFGFNFSEECEGSQVAMAEIVHGSNACCGTPC